MYPYLYILEAKISGGDAWTVHRDLKRVCFREESAVERWPLVEVRLYSLYSFTT